MAEETANKTIVKALTRRIAPNSMKTLVLEQGADFGLMPEETLLPGLEVNELAVDSNGVGAYEITGSFNFLASAKREDDLKLIDQAKNLRGYLFIASINTRNEYLK